MSLVSVVIPAHNAETYLGETICSILGQTYGRLEVLVVDDGSTDGTAGVARGFGEPVRYFRQENAGPSAARNLGIVHARGEYVAFVDADDRFLPERVAVMVAALENASPQAMFAATDVHFWDGSGCLRRFDVSQPPGGERGLDAFLDDNRPYIGVLARRSVLEAAGGFRPELWWNEDYDLWLRLLTDRHTYVYLPEALYLYRVYHASLSRDPVRPLRTACRVHQEAMRALPLTWDQRRRVAYLLWRDRARVHAALSRSARENHRGWEWASHLAASAACQAVRVLMRPRFSLNRLCRHQENRLDGVLGVVGE